jgi:putative transposase
MPRTVRASVGGFCYHVLNRGNARATIFHKDSDYRAFLDLIGEACDRLPMRVLAYCLLPNHFHLALWPQGNGDLSRWMQWLLTSHVRRYHKHYHSSGHVWQGRFKAFPIEEDNHLLTVLRYIERNPVRAGLVSRAEHWPWSSLHWWRQPNRPFFFDPGPVPRGSDWVQWVNEPTRESELESIRQSVSRGAPFGSRDWTESTAALLGLESSLRPRGRPLRGRTVEK